MKFKIIKDGEVIETFEAEDARDPRVFAAAQRHGPGDYEVTRCGEDEEE